MTELIVDFAISNEVINDADLNIKLRNKAIESLAKGILERELYTVIVMPDDYNDYFQEKSNSRIYRYTIKVSV